MTRSLPDAQKRASDTAADVGTSGEPVPRFARWPVLGVAAMVAAVHLVVGARPRRYFDEALQLAIGRYHLDWGSVDQPPITPLLAKLADLVVPDSPLALAVPAVLATAGAVVVASLIARELGGDVWPQSLTALAQATGVWVAKVGHWLTPYTLEPLLWLAIVWVLVRWIRLRDDRLLLVLGVVVGLAAQIKFQTMLLAVVLLGCLALLGPRALLRRPRFWVGAGLALVIATPTLLWQASRGWPQLRLSSIVAKQVSQEEGRWGVAVGLVSNSGLLGILLGGIGLIAPFVVPTLRDHRFLAAGFTVLFVAYVIPPGRVYYLAGAYGILAAIGAVALQRRATAGRFRWETIVVWPVLALSVLMAAHGLRASTSEGSPLVADAVAEGTARTYRTLPLDLRGNTAIMADTFMYAAYLDSSPRALGLPPAASGHVGYGYMPPPADDKDAVLFVGTEPFGPVLVSSLRPFFDEVHEVARIEPGGEARARHLYGGKTATRVWLLQGRHLPWTALWPAVRTLG